MNIRIDFPANFHLLTNFTNFTFRLLRDKKAPYNVCLVGETPVTVRMGWD
jgi:hypothetical protein